MLCCGIVKKILQKYKIMHNAQCIMNNFFKGIDWDCYISLIIKKVI